MTKVSVSQLNMFNAVIAYCTDNATTVATVPAFQTALTAFEAIVNQIQSTAQMQVNVITGITTDKRKTRAALCKQAAKLGGVISAFAATADNNQLKEQVTFSVSDLIHLKDEILVATCSNIHDALNTNVAALANYGVTAATVTAFQAAITAFDAKIATPRNALSMRTAHAKSLKSLFQQANGILRTQMDKLIAQFQDTADDFYTAYKSNRVVVGPGAPVAPVK